MSQVITTNNDATNTKYSCAKLGYFKDDALRLFANSNKRRQPLINRGTYARVSAVRGFTKAFLESGGKQVVTLGAGFDTSYFALHTLPNAKSAHWFECDFMELTLHKSTVIQREVSLNSLLSGVNVDKKGTLTADNYSLFPTDLRNLEKFTSSLLSFGFKVDVPTLVISECVLVYLDKEESDRIISWFGTKCNLIQFALYEMIKPNDPFGKQMIKALNMRGCPLKSVPQFPTMESQVSRFNAAGFSHVEVQDMLQIYNNYIPKEDTKRVAIIERLDEVEEWILIQTHYCFIVATRCNSKTWTHATLDGLKEKLQWY